jgi:hypothetical protein
MNYRYTSSIEKIVYIGGVSLGGWVEMTGDPRRWKVTIWRKGRGLVPVRVWTKVYKRKAAAERAARDTPGRYASHLARTGRCHNRRPDVRKGAKGGIA